MWEKATLEEAALCLGLLGAVGELCSAIVVNMVMRMAEWFLDSGRCVIVTLSEKFIDEQRCCNYFCSPTGSWKRRVDIPPQTVLVNNCRLHFRLKVHCKQQFQLILAEIWKLLENRKFGFAPGGLFEIWDCFTACCGTMAFILILFIAVRVLLVLFMCGLLVCVNRCELWMFFSFVLLRS